MTPEDLVRALCARHGLPPESGAPYLPLVRQALGSPGEIRDHILTLVNQSLSQHPPRTPPPPPDHAVLLAVARVLHAWAPSNSMLDLGSTMGSGPEAS